MQVDGRVVVTLVCENAIASIAGSQAITVAGLTIIRADRQLAHTLDSVTQNIRSWGCTWTTLLAARVGSELLSQGKVLNYKSAAGFQQGSK